MKKLFFALMFGVVLASCSSTPTEPSINDSTPTDSIMTDSVIVDTMTV